MEHLQPVMPGLVPGIHVDGRAKPGHDGLQRLVSIGSDNSEMAGTRCAALRRIEAG
jgi:hypothetical protein